MKNLYLDPDGVILTKDGEEAKYLKEFLKQLQMSLIAIDLLPTVAASIESLYGGRIDQLYKKIDDI